MGARPEHGVLSHALTLSANGVDVGEVDEVVEDAAKGVETAEREREREKEDARAGEREKEKERTGSCKEADQERNEEKKRRGRRAGEETGDKERRVDDEGRRR